MKKWLIISFTFFLFNCTPKAISYINSEANFGEYKTFRIVSTKLDGRKIEPERIQFFDDLKSQIIHQMIRRSYSQSSVSPDLTLRYEFSSNSKYQNNNNPVNSPINALGYPTDVNTRTIQESILILELYDERKKLVWQGSYDLRQEKKVHKASIAIKKAVDIIFTSYPYMAGSNETHQELTSLKKKKNE